MKAEGNLSLLAIFLCTVEVLCIIIIFGILVDVTQHAQILSMQLKMLLKTVRGTQAMPPSQASSLFPPCAACLRSSIALDASSLTLNPSTALTKV